MHNKVRVRFAPSPTGTLHIGAVRTALYNCLFAKKHQGIFILRIEDTDQNRFVPESEAYIEQVLSWLDITPEEGPQQGGDYGPYRQSERKHLYQQYIQQLLANGKAYYAFDTPEELENMRARKKNIGVQAPKYNAITRMSMQNSLTLPPGQVEEHLATGTPYVIRMHINPQETIKIKDAVRGWVQVQASTLDDKVLMKSDGMPTYHLANIVDDHLMKITHVIRGEEWLPSTPTHQLLYEHFGWTPPIFVHLPLILKANGKGKLSKRSAMIAGDPIFPLNWTDEATKKTLIGFKEKGYLPNALNNFLALLGWSPGNNQEIFTRQELIDKFSLNQINKAGVRFDIQKAQWFNQQHLKATKDEVLAEKYLLPLLKKQAINTTLAYATAVCKLAKERAIFPHDLWGKNTYLFQKPTAYPMDIINKKWTASSYALFQKLIDTFATLHPWTSESIQQTIEHTTSQYQLKKGQVIPLIRIALTGTKSGPDLLQIINLLGAQETSHRIAYALNQWKLT